MNSPLQVRDLQAQQAETTLFRDISFDLKTGEMICVSGPNGAGKTTLLRMLCGLIAPAAGEIERNVALIYVGHRLGIHPLLTVKENLQAMASLCDYTNDLAAIAKRVGLEAQYHLLARQLSAGQRQRLALARLCLTAAPLWILDEPCTSLDQAGVAWFETLLKQHIASAGMAILSSHQTLSLSYQQVIALGAASC